MPRLKASGSSGMTPCRPKSELKLILRDITNGHEFDDDDIEQYFWTLSSIIGNWFSERGRLEIGPIHRAFLTTAENLRDASTLLAGTETGFRTGIEIAVASRILSALASDPAIGSREAARELIVSFRQASERISNACIGAAACLPKGPDKRGQKTKDWYDLFKALLLRIAKNAGVEPTLNKRKVPTGWLLDAALELESFLPKEMRSPSDGARYTRLERSKARPRRV